MLFVCSTSSAVLSVGVGGSAEEKKLACRDPAIAVTIAPDRFFAIAMYDIYCNILYVWCVLCPVRLDRA